MGATKRRGTRSRTSQKSSAKKRTPARPVNPGEITDTLLKNIRSIELAQKETFGALTNAVVKRVADLEKFLDKHTEGSVRKADPKKFKLPVASLPELDKLANSLASAASSAPISTEGLFLVLVSKWDAFIGSMLRWMFSVHPEKIDSSERRISFSDLRRIGTVGDARDKIIDDEVQSVLRESHVDQFAYLEKQLSIPLRKDLDIWPTFVELTQRRNLIAHTNGRITDQYLKVCTANDVKLEDGAELGKVLGVRPSYLRTSCDCLIELGFKLSQVIWRKIESHSVKETDDHLTSTTFKMVEAGQYAPAIKILAFSLIPPMRFPAERSRLVCIVNLAQAYKWSGKNEECTRLLDGEDWSAANLDFRLAVAVLQDDFVTAARMMKQIGANGEVTKENYENWPVFRNFRKSKFFLEAYRDTFRTEIETRTVPPDLAPLLTDADSTRAPRKAAKPRKRQVRKRTPTKSAAAKEKTTSRRAKRSAPKKSARRSPTKKSG